MDQALISEALADHAADGLVDEPIVPARAVL